MTKQQRRRRVRDLICVLIGVALTCAAVGVRLYVDYEARQTMKIDYMWGYLSELDSAMRSGR